MTEDIDVYRAAALLIKKHGEDAPIHAAMRADELLAAGDIWTVFPFGNELSER